MPIGQRIRTIRGLPEGARSKPEAALTERAEGTTAEVRCSTSEQDRPASSHGSELPLPGGHDFRYDTPGAIAGSKTSSCSRLSPPARMERAEWVTLCRLTENCHRTSPPAWRVPAVPWQASRGILRMPLSGRKRRCSAGPYALHIDDRPIQTISMCGLLAFNGSEPASPPCEGPSPRRKNHSIAERGPGRSSSLGGPLVSDALSHDVGTAATDTRTASFPRLRQQDRTRLQRRATRLP